MNIRDAKPGDVLADRDGAIWLRGVKRARCLHDTEDGHSGDNGTDHSAAMDIGCIEKFGPFTIIYPQADAGADGRLRDAERRAEEAEAERTRQMLLATAADMKAQKANAQAAAGRVAIRMLMDDHDPNTYSRCQDRECDHVRLGLSALGDDAGRALLDRLRAAEADRDALRAEVEKESALRAELTAELHRMRADVARLQSEIDAARAIIESGASR